MKENPGLYVSINKETNKEFELVEITKMGLDIESNNFTKRKQENNLPKKLDVDENKTFNRLTSYLLRNSDQMNELRKIFQ